MGIIKAAASALGGGLADQWLEIIRADDMSGTTVLSPGVKVRGKDKRNQNKKGTDETISNGSIIQVDQNQFMILVDGGKVIDYTAEPGYYKVDASSNPSMFNGELNAAITETFERIKYGGVTPYSQKAYFINLQEIKDIAFGTASPINYFDDFYNAELYLRAFGYFSIKITDPLKFFAEAIPRNQPHVDIADIQKLYISEFLTALQTSISKMSVDGIRISHVTSKAQDLANYMSEILDSSWTEKRGMQVLSVGISSITYDDESKKLINLRNQGAMLSDASIREGYVQGAAARGLEAAGSNAAGSMAGFMGMGMAGQTSGAFLGAASQSNQAQIQRAEQERLQAEQARQQSQLNASPKDGWVCECGAQNAGKFCQSCGKPKPIPNNLGAWMCECGVENVGKFCQNCGKSKLILNASGAWVCKCGTENTGKFCQNCGTQR